VAALTTTTVSYNNPMPPRPYRVDCAIGQHDWEGIKLPGEPDDCWYRCRICGHIDQD